MMAWHDIEDDVDDRQRREAIEHARSSDGHHGQAEHDADAKSSESSES
jgi:hypothetical protein